MDKEKILAKWKEIKPYNQVWYRDDVALITGYRQQEKKYLISVIKDGHIECHDVNEIDLKPIQLDYAGEMLRKLQPNKVTPFECVFADKDELNKVSVAFCNNYCYVIKDGNEIYSDVVCEFHVIQNILREVFGYTIYFTEDL